MEYMFVFSKGKIKTFHPIMVPTKEAGRRITNNLSQRKVSGEKREDRRISRFDTYVKAEKPLSNVWDIAIGGYPDHPATFPLSLAKNHILSWSNEGDMVLDPFVGSGTTCIAAKQLGRQYIGIEREAEYVEIAEARINAVTTLAV